MKRQPQYVRALLAFAVLALLVVVAIVEYRLWLNRAINGGADGFFALNAVIAALALGTAAVLAWRPKE